MSASTPIPTDSGTTLTPRRCLLLSFLAVWFAFQILFPLRHLLYPGSPSWTEEGHRFAWQMKLRDKSGTATFELRDPATGQSWTLRNRDHLSPRQARKMPGRPDMILQFAHHLAELWRAEHGIENVEVRATVWVSLNGRAPALLIDPKRDLTKITRSLRHADWILPLEEPFRRE